MRPAAVDELRLGDVVEAVGPHSGHGDVVEIGEVGFVAYEGLRQVGDRERFVLVSFVGGGFLEPPACPVRKIDPRRLGNGCARAIAVARTTLTKFETALAEAFADVPEEADLPDVRPLLTMAHRAVDDAAQAAGLAVRYRAAKAKARRET